MRLRDQHEIALLQRQRFPVTDRQQAGAFQHRAIKRLAFMRALHTPRAGGADDFGIADAWLKQAHYFIEGIGHVWTLANEKWTIDCSKSGDG
jgi:hypothetical protein